MNKFPQISDADDDTLIFYTHPPFEYENAYFASRATLAETTNSHCGNEHWELTAEAKVRRSLDIKCSLNFPNAIDGIDPMRFH